MREMSERAEEIQNLKDRVDVLWRERAARLAEESSSGHGTEAALAKAIEERDEAQSRVAELEDLVSCQETVIENAREILKD